MTIGQVCLDDEKIAIFLCAAGRDGSRRGPCARHRGINDAQICQTGQIDEVAEQGGKLLPNVHGLFIYEREGNEVFFHLSANARVTTDPSMFLNGMASSFDETPGLGEREQTALALIALSKIAREPLAEAALCISAVEYLSTD